MEKVFNHHPKEIILAKIKELRPLNYNQFRWWRRYDSPNPSLDNKSPLLHRIRNGDFDFSHYFWQAQFCEYEMNEKLKSSSDYVDWMEKTQLDRARRSKLYIDYEKDEENKLNELRKEFVKVFIITEEEYDLELENFEGTIEEFYFYVEEKYKKYIKPLSKRGRKPKKK